MLQISPTDGREPYPEKDEQLVALHQAGDMLGRYFMGGHAKFVSIEPANGRIQGVLAKRPRWETDEITRVYNPMTLVHYFTPDAAVEIVRWSEQDQMRQMRGATARRLIHSAPTDTTALAFAMVGARLPRHWSHDEPCDDDAHAAELESKENEALALFLFWHARRMLRPYKATIERLAALLMEQRTVRTERACVGLIRRAFKEAGQIDPVGSHYRKERRKPPKGENVVTMHGAAHKAIRTLQRTNDADAFCRAVLTLPGAWVEFSGREVTGYYSFNEAPKPLLRVWWKPGLVPFPTSNRNRRWVVRRPSVTVYDALREACKRHGVPVRDHTDQMEITPVGD